MHQLISILLNSNLQTIAGCIFFLFCHMHCQAGWNLCTHALALGIVTANCSCRIFGKHLIGSHQ